MSSRKNKLNCLNVKNENLKNIIDDKELYNELRASIALDYDENKTKQYFAKRVINDKNIWDDKTFNSKYESLKKECEQSHNAWMFGENSVCFFAYIAVFVTAVLAIIDSLGKINDEKLNCITIIAIFILLFFSLFINKLEKSNSQKKNRLVVLFVVCNKFLPTLTFLLTFLTCVLKICTHKWFWIFLIIGTIIFAFVIVIEKFSLYSQVNNDISAIK